MESDNENESDDDNIEGSANQDEKPASPTRGKQPSAGKSEKFHHRLTTDKDTDTHNKVLQALNTIESRKKKKEEDDEDESESEEDDEAGNEESESEAEEAESKGRAYHLKEHCMI